MGTSASQGTFSLEALRRDSRPPPASPGSQEPRLATGTFGTAGSRRAVYHDSLKPRARLTETWPSARQVLWSLARSAWCPDPATLTPRLPA